MIRTDAAVNSENLLINNDHFEQFKRILSILLFIYEGVPIGRQPMVCGNYHYLISHLEVRLDRADK